MRTRSSRSGNLAKIAVLICVSIFGLHPLGSAQNIISTYAGGGPTNGPAISAAIPTPFGVAADQIGNFYVSSPWSSRVYKVDSSGHLSVVAGNGCTVDWYGDGLPALKACVVPYGIAIDHTNGVFVTQWANVMRVDAITGIITRVAGDSSGTGFSGDGGPATHALLNHPNGVAVDNVSGDFFIADTNNNRIRRVSNGIITTIAGNGINGFSGDGGPATQAELSAPYGVALFGSILYIADTGNSRIRQVDLNTHTISTFWGINLPCAINIFSLCHPEGVAVDSSGIVFISDTFQYRTLKTDGSFATLVAGGNGPGYCGDGGLSTNACLNAPVGVAVDRSENFYIADQGNLRVRKVTSPGPGIISTAAGNGGDGDGLPATAATLFQSYGVALDGIGNGLIVDAGSDRIRQVDKHTHIISTIAGGFRRAGFCGDGGLAVNACLNFPEDVAADAFGDIFIADAGNQRIRKVSGGIIMTVAGNGINGFSGDGGPATQAELSYPSGVAVDSSGNLFIADVINQRVREVSGGIINTVAGNGVQGFGGDGGPATAAKLSYPQRVTVDASGNLFIVDNGNNRIRRVDALTHIITTIAGNGTCSSSGDGGPAIAAGLCDPQSAVLDSAGNVFIGDVINERVRRVDAATGTIATVAGNGAFSFSVDGILATKASLMGPGSVATDAAGNIYLTDDEGGRIRTFVSAPSVNLPASIISFGSQVINTTSLARFVTLTNTGSATLQIASISATGNFAQTNNCGASVAPALHCTISITFTPLALGTQTGRVTVVDNAGNQNVFLTGIGTP